MNYWKKINSVFLRIEVIMKDLQENNANCAYTTWKKLH